MEITIKDTCLLCNKNFEWNEVILCKLPENACFCLNCTEKFEDKNEYRGINTWIVVEYQPGIIFEYNKTS